MTDDFNWRFARQCPECGSKDFERGVTCQRRIKVVNGIVERSHQSMIDAGYFRCLKCGFEAHV